MDHGELRATPLAPLPRAVSVTLPRRRFPTRVVANFASAAALLVVAVTGVTAATNVPERSGLSDQAVAIDTGFEDPLCTNSDASGCELATSRSFPPTRARASSRRCRE